MLQCKVCGVSAAVLFAGLACAAALAEQAECWGQACVAEEPRAGLVQVRKRKLAKRGAAAVNASAGLPNGDPCTADSDCDSGRCAGNSLDQGGTCRGTGSGIDIALFDQNPCGSDGQDNIKGYFLEAKQKYLDVIKGHWFQENYDVTVNILWAVEVIDGPGGILGSAGVTSWISFGPFSAPFPAGVAFNYGGKKRALPGAGQMRFDVNDLGDGEAYDYLARGVIIHEMAHIMGIGTSWNINSQHFSFTACQCWASNPPDSHGHYFTPDMHASVAYERLGGYLPSGYTSFDQTPPIEKTLGGCGTKCAHFDEGIFDSELMTGFANGGLEFSIVSVGASEDAGFVVDYGAADPYVLPPQSQQGQGHKEGFEINKHILRPRWTIFPASTPKIGQKVRASVDKHWNETTIHLKRQKALRDKYRKG